ncbi:hypothetical protein HID58_038116 [Brassica napus]|uniref:Uncharacterized protein n=1 Tax=Brassica napus TaxID=3708 RepID=A0ABQ8BN77_BRANA|nr:hypothetical protein HID58_038116 [Brassica napus]
MDPVNDESVSPSLVKWAISHPKQTFLQPHLLQLVTQQCKWILQFLYRVVRCCLEHAASVAKTFLMSDCVVVEIKEPKPVFAGNLMDNSDYS